MSLAAASMLRLRSNWTVTAVAPSELVDVICETPGIWAICRSSGWGTEAGIVAGGAAGTRLCRAAGDLHDLPFERPSDRGRHRVRGSAGQRSRYGDGGEVDLRQGRNRQRRERDQTDKKHRDHNQRGRDRAVNEGG